MRFAAGDTQENFFQAEFVFAQRKEFGAVVDQGVSDDAVVSFIVLGFSLRLGPKTDDQKAKE